MITSNLYEAEVAKQLAHCLTETDLGAGKKYRGKVRDTYDLGDHLVLITTDRQSAFDRVLASVPFKGQVLNLTSAWWFEQTQHIVPNHMLALPDPNVLVAKKCQVFPIEFVVRAYITGTTSTSLWTQYANGERLYCGHALPEGLVKNQVLDQPILTPTTKDAAHDKPIAEDEIIRDGWMSAEDFAFASQAALKLFEFGSKIAKERGFILVDTKYEFGKDSEGNILLIDEVHTPDSSRYWRLATYAERFAHGLEPESLDKESLRLWFVKNCDPYKDAILPKAPDELIIKLALSYIELYETISAHRFHFTDHAIPVMQRIRSHLAGYLA